MREQREEGRSSKELNIRLYQNGNLLGLVKTVNLTASGMFIQTDALLFPRGTQIDIVFDDPETSIRYCIPAQVIHRSLKGIGVKFQTQDISGENKNFKEILECTRVVA